MAAAIDRISLKLNRTAAQVAIRWLLEREEISCVLTGIKTPKQAEANALSADWSLPEYARSELSQVAEALRLSR
jgi:aryl-alcohol dehydrogenase-like predicted oxidoreductase